MARKNLMEAYRKRISIAEAVYSRNHEGQKMDNHRKLTVAKVLDNTNKFLTEAFGPANATQRADMGEYKRFCLNLTNVALPNLIANELVIVHPMSSMTGYITYINYLAGTAKGDIEDNHLFNNPFELGDVKSGTYTADRVVEGKEAGSSTKFTALSWTPVVKGAFEYNNTKYDVKITSGNDGTVSYGYVNPADNKVYTDSAYTTEYSSNYADKVAYVYDNIIIPQNDLPTLTAKMESISLLAKARRIAVFYSQIAAFQAKTDYGFDLGDQLAEKAVGQLSYEIDTEVVKLLDDTAAENAAATGGFETALTWSKTLPVGVSKQEHYEGFTEIVEIARQKIYDQTRRFAPNYMIVASNVIPVLSFINGYTAAPAGMVNGPYFAGTLNSLKVFVSPALEPGTFCVGCNGEDMMSSVAVYAPYMAIVPTQLLQYADGGTSQGWSTLYDLKVLNKNLIVRGRITD